MKDLLMNLKFLEFDISKYFSYHLLFTLINCLIGMASKNSFAINIVG
mgnify:CR=1 FL=1